MACIHGIKEALKWVDMPMFVEADRTTSIHVLSDKEDWSRSGHFLKEAIDLSVGFREKWGTEAAELFL